MATPEALAQLEAGLPARLPRELEATLVAITAEPERWNRQRRVEHCFADATDSWRGQIFHARDLDPRHLEFFGGRAMYRERYFMAAVVVAFPLVTQAVAAWIAGVTA